ncbi:MAG: glycoside hydrolase family 15 protein, partial [Elusimicrobia bacterium]
LDATSLLIPMMGFLPFNDSRVIGTIKATTERLMTNGLVHRYEGDDGLPGKEGTFVLCTFWLVETLALSGQVEKAEEIFTGLLKYISPLGLFAEEINPVSGEQLGNYPQAFSHIGLINSALYLGIAKGRKQMGPQPLGK